MSPEDVRVSQTERFQQAAGRAREALRRIANFYIDLNEEAASRLFEAGQRLAERLEATPFYPLIELQQTYARKAFEYWVRGARLVAERL